MWRVAPSATTLSLLLVAAAGAQPRHPSLALEDSYRRALADAAVGSLSPALARIVVLERQSSPECVQAIELHTAEQLARREPESLVVQAFLRLAVRQARYKTRGQSRDLFGFERVSIGSLEQLGDLYVATSGHGDARSVTAGLFTYMAHGVVAVRSTQRLGAARDLLETAVKLDSNHPAALHSLAVILELLGRPGQALPHLERLVTLEPDNARYRVRQAVVSVKSGRLERGEQLLRELTADGPIWARELATQELARLLSADGREDEAVALLRAALLELPGEKLYLQLGALLDPRWADSWEVIGPWLAKQRRDAGPSARWLYENGVEADIDTLRLELGSGVASRLDGLESALSRLPTLPDRHRKTLGACR